MYIYIYICIYIYIYIYIDHYDYVLNIVNYIVLNIYFIYLNKRKFLENRVIYHFIYNFN